MVLPEFYGLTFEAIEAQGAEVPDRAATERTDRAYLRAASGATAGDTEGWGQRSPHPFDSRHPG